MANIRKVFYLCLILLSGFCSLVIFAAVTVPAIISCPESSAPLQLQRISDISQFHSAVYALMVLLWMVVLLAVAIPALRRQTGSRP
jgi:hypothetical protein